MASTGGKSFKVLRSLHCGARPIHYHTTWCQSGGHFILSLRCYRLEAVIAHRRDPSQKSCCKAVCSSQYRDISRRRPRIGFNEHRKHLGNVEEVEENTLHRMTRVDNFWGCCRADKTYVLHRRNHALETRRWPRWDTFRTPKRSSMHNGQSSNMMARLHSNCR